MHVLSPFLAMKPRKPKFRCIFECANQFRLYHVHNSWSVNFPSTTAEICFNHHLNLQPVLDITNNRKKNTILNTDGSLLTFSSSWDTPKIHKHVGVYIYKCVCYVNVNEYLSMHVLIFLYPNLSMVYMGSYVRRYMHLCVCD